MVRSAYTALSQGVSWNDLTARQRRRILRDNFYYSSAGPDRKFLPVAKVDHKAVSIVAKAKAKQRELDTTNRRCSHSLWQSNSRAFSHGYISETEKRSNAALNRRQGLAKHQYPDDDPLVCELKKCDKCIPDSWEDESVTTEVGTERRHDSTRYSYSKEVSSAQMTILHGEPRFKFWADVNDEEDPPTGDLEESMPTTLSPVTTIRHGEKTIDSFDDSDLTMAYGAPTRSTAEGSVYNGASFHRKGKTEGASAELASKLDRRRAIIESEESITTDSASFGHLQTFYIPTVDVEELKTENAKLFAANSELCLKVVELQNRLDFYEKMGTCPDVSQATMGGFSHLVPLHQLDGLGFDGSELQYPRACVQLQCGSGSELGIDPSPFSLSCVPLQSSAGSELNVHRVDNLDEHVSRIGAIEQRLDKLVSIDDKYAGIAARIGLLEQRLDKLVDYEHNAQNITHILDDRQASLFAKVDEITSLVEHMVVPIRTAVVRHSQILKMFASKKFAEGSGPQSPRACVQPLCGSGSEFGIDLRPCSLPCDPLQSGAGSELSAQRIEHVRLDLRTPSMSEFLMMAAASRKAISYIPCPSWEWCNRDAVKGMLALCDEKSAKKIRKGTPVPSVVASSSEAESIDDDDKDSLPDGDSLNDDEIEKFGCMMFGCAPAELQADKDIFEVPQLANASALASFARSSTEARPLVARLDEM